MTQDTKLQQLVINKLTTAQYQAALDAGTIDPNQLYMTTDSQTLRDVTVNGSSIVSNNTVELGTMALETASNYSTKAVADTLYAQKALETTVAGKLDKISTASKVYGTDVNGNQTSYDITSFGNVDDVKVGTTSVVANKIATLGTMAGQPTTNYYTKSEIDGKLSAGMHYKGTVASYSDLPTTGNQTGDLYNVTDTGANYAWSGTAWDKLSENIDLSGVVPNTRTINGKALSTNITLSASDVGALPSSTVIPIIDSSLSTTSTNGVQNKLITNELNNKLDNYHLRACGNWTGGLHAVNFVTFDYSTSDSENGIFIKISMVNSHGNGITGRFFQDVILNCNYTGVVAGTIYRYFAESIESGMNAYLDHKWGDIFWTIDTTNKIVKFYVLMRQYSWTYMTPYFRLNASTKGVISQKTGQNNEEYSSGTQYWASINNLDAIPSTVAELTDASNYALVSSLPSIATTSTAGLVKPDGTSITVDANGVISSAAGVEIDEETITKNSSDELQTVAIVNPNTNNNAINPLKIWNGTEYQWNHGEATVWNYWQTSETAMWTASTMPSSAKWRSVTYGDGKFVVIAGNSNKAAYSTDGINWTETTLPSSYAWKSVIYGDGKFVAVAESSAKSAYSTDGINWTETTLPSSTNWISISYGNGIFVAVAWSSNKAAYSTDGINWTETTMPSSADWDSIAYGDGKFVAVTVGSNQSAYSTDGINWTASIIPSDYWQNIAYGNSKFVVVADGSAKSAYSTDGINWTETTMPSSTYWHSVTYGDGKFVVVASLSNKAAYSTDGINWIASTLPSSANWTSIAYGNGIFVAVAYDSDASAIFTISYDKCYTLDSTPTTSSQVYSAPEITSAKTITSVGSGTITLSDNLVYNSTPSGNQNTYRTLGDAHPNWICNINNVGVKIGNTTIATAGGSDVEALTDSEIEELWDTAFYYCWELSLDLYSYGYSGYHYIFTTSENPQIGDTVYIPVNSTTLNNSSTITNLSSSPKGIYIQNNCGHERNSSKDTTDPINVINWSVEDNIISCLTGDTLVTMYDKSTKRLDEIELGDKVLSVNTDTGKLEQDDVIFTDKNEFKIHNNYDLWTFSNNFQVKTVKRHRFYNVESNSFKYMDEWNIGEHTIDIQGNWLELLSHEVVEETVRHYKITTEKYHNYFANGMLTGSRLTKPIKYENLKL